MARLLTPFVAFALSLALPVTAGHVLFDFEDGLAGWRVNVYGSGELIFTPVADAALGQGALAVCGKGLKGGNLIGPAFPTDTSWRARRCDRLRFRARASTPLTSGQIVFVTDEATHPTYNLHFTVDGDAWSEHVYPLTRCWNRGRQRLDAARLKQIYVNPGGADAEFQIDQIELLEAARKVHLVIDRASTLADAPERGVQVGPLALEERHPGDCLLRVPLRALAASSLRWRVTVQAPGAAAVAGFGGEVQAGPQGGELEAALAFPATVEGEARFAWSLGLADGAEIDAQEGTFQVLLPSTASLDRVVLVPSPRQMTTAPGQFGVEAGSVIRCGASGRTLTSAAVLQRELAAVYGVVTMVRAHGAPAVPPVDGMLVGLLAELPELGSELALRRLPGQAADLRPEGYVLCVEPDRVLLAGADDRGVYYGVRTLLQLISAATSAGQAPTIPACRIVDWPEHAVRAAMIYPSGWPQDPLDPAMLKEYLYRQVAGYKLNTLVWQVEAGYRYSTWPKLANRPALTREQVREVADFARDHFLEVIPATNLLGHTDWIGLKYPGLQEDGKPHQICTRHPDTYPLIWDLLDEMLELFDQPKRLHVGLDEVRWQTFSLPPEQRCERCRDVPKWRIYADHVKRLHEYLAGRGVEMWLWSDMLEPTHNGGPPFDCRLALDPIPRDVVICNWSAEYSPGSSARFASKGFRVVKSNSMQVSASEAPHVIGNLASFWYRHPWCPVSQTGERGLLLQQAYAAEFSWHTNREDIGLERFGREQDLNILRLVARPALPAGAAECLPVDLATAAAWPLQDDEAGDGRGWADLGPDLDVRHMAAGAVRIGGAEFQVPAGRCVYLGAPGSTASVTVAVGRPAASLLLLHTAIPPTAEAAREAYLKRFLVPNEGVAVSLMRVHYEGGRSVDVPLRAGMEVGFWRPREQSEYLVRCPGLLRVATASCRRETPGDTDAVVYVLEWPNVETKATVAAVEFVHAGTEAAYAVLGISTRALRP